jgi:lysozyme family protein
MTESTFAVCYPWLRESEGGNDDDPNDPGGRTSRGITQREYDAYCTIHGFSHGDVWQAPEVSIANIYEGSYWYPYCHALPSGPDYVFFDECVNAGPHEAALVLQRALGVVDDGHIGVVTMAAVAKADPVHLVKAMSYERVKVYDRMRGFRRYGKGWLSRVEFCRRKALTLITPTTVVA